MSPALTCLHLRFFFTCSLPVSHSPSLFPSFIWIPFSSFSFSYTSFIYVFLPLSLCLASVHVLFQLLSSFYVFLSLILFFLSYLIFSLSFPISPSHFFIFSSLLSLSASFPISSFEFLFLFLLHLFTSVAHLSFADFYLSQLQRYTALRYKTENIMKFNILTI
jgi:hypothetical protein